MTEVLSNAEIQFQNTFNSPDFGSAVDLQKDGSIINVNSHDHEDISASNSSAVHINDEQHLPLSVPPLQSVISDQSMANGSSDADNHLGALLLDSNDQTADACTDDLFNVEMFDFGVSQEDLANNSSFAMFADQHTCDDQDGYNTINNHSTEDVNNLTDTNNSTTALVAVDTTDPWDQQLLITPTNLLRSDSDGLTDLEDQFIQQQQHMQNADLNNYINSTFPDSNVPIIGLHTLHDQVMNWPQLNDPQCMSCQIFRQIIHSNGIQDTKLEIHGRNGQFYHAVLHTRYCVNGLPSAVEQQIVEFAMANSEYVQQFLLQYSFLRRKEGFVVRYDSVSAYSDAICGMNDGMDMYFNATPSPFLNQPLQQTFLNPYELAAGLQASPHGFHPGQPLSNQFWTDRSYPANYGARDQAGNPIAPVKPPKSNVAAQRERTGKLKMSDLAKYFHLPINAAAKELAICPTVLKKICRRNGMRRWPHRKIKSIERIIMTLEQTIAEGNGEGVEGIRMEIAMLKNERAQLCSGVVGESK